MKDNRYIHDPGVDRNSKAVLKADREYRFTGIVIQPSVTAFGQGKSFRDILIQNLGLIPSKTVFKRIY